MAETKKSRAASINDLLTAAERKKNSATFAVWFRGERQPFIQFQVPTTLLLYNVKNGRTQTAQLQYIEEHGLPTDFFDDPEDQEVQKAQEKILLGLVSQEELDTDIIEKGQENPLVITADGIVIDGNRRLAILRREGETHASAVALPADAKPADIYETEVVIQMSRDTKAAYNWVNELRVVERGLKELKLDKKAIAKLRRTTIEEIEHDINRLAVVDLYLQWLGEPKKYNRIPTTEKSEGEEIFTQLTDRRFGKEFKNRDEATKTALMNASFAAIKAKGGYKDLRRIWTHLPKKAHLILERSAEDPDWPAKPEAAGKKTAKLGPLAKVKPAGKEQPAVTELAAILGDPVTAATAAPILLDAVEKIDDEEKALKKLDPLQRIDKARSTLEEVELSGAEINPKEIEKALGKVEEQIERIRADLEELGE